MSILNKYDGYKTRKIELIKKGIEKSKEKPFSTVLSSLGIPDAGPKVCELLIKAGYNSIEKIFEIAKPEKSDQLLSINGIGIKTAESIIKNFNNEKTRETIIKLRDCGLSMKEEIIDNVDTVKIFNGQSWCITGSFENFKPRKLAEDEIKKRGGNIVSQVSSRTTHLLCGESPGSKYEAARELGIIIVDETGFIGMIK